MTMGKEESAKKLKEEIASYDLRLKRALADYDNLQKRVAQEKQLWVAQANLKLIQELLPVLDLLKKAQDSLGDPGLKMVVSEFDQLLKRHNLEAYGSSGDNFDPNLHEVVDIAVGGKPGEIAEVLTSGFKIGDQVVRPAKVRVYHDKS